MRYLPLLLLLAGCETEEVRALKARRAYLEDRLGELQQLQAEGHTSSVEEFRRSLASSAATTSLRVSSSSRAW